MQHYVDALSALDKQVAQCILPDGEQYKDIQHLNLILMDCLRLVLTEIAPYWHWVVVSLVIWLVLHRPVFSVG